MTHSARLRLAALATVAAAAALGGCANRPVRDVQADGSYCYRVSDRSRHPTCTRQPIPTLAQDAQAKSLQPDPAALTVLVVRNRWSDASKSVDLWVDERAVATTLPASFVRLRLAPGSHRLAVRWQDQRVEQLVEGGAGETAVVELVGSLSAWHSSYRLEPGEPASSTERIRKARLVADLDLR